MCGRIPLFFVWLILVFLLIQAKDGFHPVYAQTKVIINISGDLTESQRRNIRSHLSLARLKEQDSLSEAMFNRLYEKIEKEAALSLESFGYYTPAISASWQWQDGNRQIDLEIETGSPVLIEELHIVLSGPGKENPALRKAVQQFPLHLHEIFDHQLYEEAKDRLIAVALESGYLKASFRHSRVEVRKKSLSAAVSLDLDTGPQYTFGPITFVADFLDQELLHKISPFKEGDVLSPQALTRLRQSLFSADYFQSVELEYDIEHAPTTAVPIKVVLTENLAHKYGIGLGYGTDTGARGTLEYTNRHINRLGHQLAIQLQPSERKSSLGGVYTIPVGDPKRDRLTVLSKYEVENFANTDSNRWLSSISRDHFRDKGEYSTFLEFLDEQYTTGSNSGHADLLIPGIRGSIYWADDRIVTGRGIRFNTSLMGSEKGALANASFLQADIQSKAIYSFWEKWRWIGRAELGTTLTNDIYDLPPSLRYYAGGDQSVRGYGYKKISPRDAKGNIIGGKDLFTYSIELERSLFDEWSSAIFYDSGAVSNDFSSMTLQTGAGFGVRWNAPFGQVRLDLAKPLNDDGSWRIHLTMGADL